MNVHERAALLNAADIAEYMLKKGHAAAEILSSIKSNYLLTDEQAAAVLKQVTK